MAPAVKHAALLMPALAAATASCRYERLSATLTHNADQPPER